MMSPTLARTRERAIHLAHTLTDAIRRREKELELSEFRWRFALEGSGSGLWDWNLEDDSVWYSPRFKQMLGYAEDELGNDLSEWSDRIHPEDRERTLAAEVDMADQEAALLDIADQAARPARRMAAIGLGQLGIGRAGCALDGAAGDEQEEPVQVLRQALGGGQRLLTRLGRQDRLAGTGASDREALAECV